MNYLALKAKATKLIKSLGFPITVTRNGTTIGSGNAVVSPSKAKREDGVTPASPMSVTTKTLYVAPSALLEIEIGDYLHADFGQWQVVAAEDIKPSTTLILYQLEVQ